MDTRGHCECDIVITVKIEAPETKFPRCFYFLQLGKDQCANTTRRASPLFAATFLRRPMIWHCIGGFTSGERQSSEVTATVFTTFRCNPGGAFFFFYVRLSTRGGKRATRFFTPNNISHHPFMISSFHVDRFPVFSFFSPFCSSMSGSCGFTTS